MVKNSKVLAVLLHERHAIYWLVERTAVHTTDHYQYETKK